MTEQVSQKVSELFNSGNQFAGITRERILATLQVVSDPNSVDKYQRELAIRRLADDMNRAGFVIRTTDDDGKKMPIEEISSQIWETEMQYPEFCVLSPTNQDGEAVYDLLDPYVHKLNAIHRTDIRTTDPITGRRISAENICDQIRSVMINKQIVMADRKEIYGTSLDNALKHLLTVRHVLTTDLEQLTKNLAAKISSDEIGKDINNDYLQGINEEAKKVLDLVKLDLDAKAIKFQNMVHNISTLPTKLSPEDSTQQMIEKITNTALMNTMLDSPMIATIFPTSSNPVNQVSQIEVLYGGDENFDIDKEIKELKKYVSLGGGSKKSSKYRSAYVEMRESKKKSKKSKQFGGVTEVEYNTAVKDHAKWFEEQITGRYEKINEQFGNLLKQLFVNGDIQLYKGSSELIFNLFKVYGQVFKAMEYLLMFVDYEGSLVSGLFDKVEWITKSNLIVNMFMHLYYKFKERKQILDTPTLFQLSYGKIDESYKQYKKFIAKKRFTMVKIMNACHTYANVSGYINSNFRAGRVVTNIITGNASNDLDETIRNKYISKCIQILLDQIPTGHGNVVVTHMFETNARPNNGYFNLINGPTDFNSKKFSDGSTVSELFTAVNTAKTTASDAGLRATVDRLKEMKKWIEAIEDGANNAINLNTIMSGINLIPTSNGIEILVHTSYAFHICDMLRVIATAVNAAVVAFNFAGILTSKNRDIEIKRVMDDAKTKANILSGMSFDGTWATLSFTKENIKTLMDSVNGRNADTWKLYEMLEAGTKIYL